MVYKKTRKLINSPYTFLPRIYYFLLTHCYVKFVGNKLLLLILYAGKETLCTIPLADILAVERVQEESFKKNNMFQIVQPKRVLYLQVNHFHAMTTLLYLNYDHTGIWEWGWDRWMTCSAIFGKWLHTSGVHGQYHSDRNS